MSTAIDKTLTRVHERVRNHEFYEAHQAVRTIVARHLKKRDYASAVSLLYNSALLLAKSHQTGSASDILLYMIKVYKEAKVKVNGANKGRVAEIAWHLKCSDAVIKQVAQKSLNWAPHDCDLAHVFGTIFVRGQNFAEAEKYLLQGTRESAVLLAEVHALCASEETDKNAQALYFSRGVLGYLSTQNMRNAVAYLHVFEEKCQHDLSGPLYEFISLLVSTCQTKDVQLYKQLANQYKPKTLVPAWGPSLQKLEQDFFGIAPQRQFDLMDMMGGFMGR